MSAVEKFIDVAKAEVGYLEKKTNEQLDDKIANAGRNNWTKYARDLDALGVYDGKKNGYAWCAVFVMWCLYKAFGLEMALLMTNQVMRGYGASCTALVSRYKAAGQWITGSPMPGDQVFFLNAKLTQMAHTGLVVRVENGRVHTIEGNTSGKAGVVDNGGGVWEKSYPLDYNRIAGYGRPDWSLVDSEEDEDMTVDRFKELWLEMRKELQDNDAGEWSLSSRTWGVDSGLIQGAGALEDGTPNYMWGDILSREQAITLLYRFAEMIKRGEI